MADGDGGGYPTTIWRAFSALGFPVLVLGTIFGLRPGEAAPPPSPRADTTSTASTGAEAATAGTSTPSTNTWCKNRLLETLRATLGGEDTERLRVPPTPDPEYQGTIRDNGTDHEMDIKVGEQKATPSKDLDFRFDATMVVLVADPVDSGTRPFFDGSIAVIRLAMARLGWVRDRQWLPWQDTLLTNPKDIETAKMCRRDVPGVMTFRRPKLTGGAGPERAVVYVVGETPTWGAQQGALAFALGDAADRRLSSVTPIPVIGPAFSGGADSLIAALRKQRTRTPSFGYRVFVGAANGDGLLEHLASSGAPVSTTNIAEPELECALWSHLAEEGRVAGEAGRLENGTPTNYLRRTAMLRESGTTFGAESNAGSGVGSGSQGNANSVSNVHGQCPYLPELELAFPIHIASVRNAYARAENIDVSNGLARRTHLDVDLAEEPGTDDPGDTSHLTAASRDAALGHLLEGISSEGIDYLGIVATDIADAIFLARKVRDVAPDVRLAFFTSDILLTHPSFRRDLFGSYVVSAYPFLGSDEFSVVPFWSGEKHVHLPFDNDGEQATMNAVVAGLISAGDGHHLGALSEFRWVDRGSDVHSDAGKKRLEWRGPFAWLSVLTRSGIVPLVARDGPDGGEFPSCIVMGAPACNSSLLLWSMLDDTVQSCAGVPDYLCRPAPTSDKIVVPCAESSAPTRVGCGSPPPAKVDSIQLHIDFDVTPPNIWTLALAVLALLAVADWSMQRVRRRAVDCDDGLWRPERGRDLELILLRLRYALAATFRSAAVLVALLFGLALDAAAFLTYSDTWSSEGTVRLGVAALAALGAAVAGGDTFVSGRAFARRWTLLASLEETPLPGSFPWREVPGDTIASGAKWLLTALGWRPTRSPGQRVWATRWVMIQQCAVASAAVALLAIGTVSAFGLHSIYDLIHDRPLPNTALLLLRALPLVSGASPAWPLLCTFFVVWFWTRMRCDIIWLRLGTVLRSTDYGASATALPITAIRRGITSKGVSDALDGFDLAELHAVDAAAGPSSTRHILGVAFTVGLLGVLLALKPVRSVESPAIEWVLRGALALDAFICLATLLHLMSYWRALRYFLARLASSELGSLLRRIDPRLRIVSPFDIPTARGRGRALARCSALLAEAIPRDGELARAVLGPDLFERIQEQLKGAEAELRELELERTRNRAASAGTEGGLVGPIVSLAAAEIAHRLRQCSPQTADQRRAVASLQRYVVSVTGMFVARYVQIIGALMLGLVLQSIGLLFAIEGYAFEPRRPLLTCVWLLMLGIAGAAVWILTETSKNEALSELGGTTAGKVDLSWDFGVHLMKWAAVPILAVAAAEYPGATGSILSWFEPVMRAIH